MELPSLSDLCSNEVECSDEITSTRKSDSVDDLIRDFSSKCNAGFVSPRNMGSQHKHQSQVDLSKVHQFGSEKDVVLECKDGTILAPKSVLMARSKYFETMFSTNMREVLSNTISFDYVPLVVMEIIMWYLYTEEIIIPKEEFVDELFNISNQFLLNDFSKQIFTAIYDSFTYSNIAHAWFWAANLRLADAERKIKLYVLQNLKVISENECFKYLTPDQIAKLICFVKHNGNYIERNSVAASTISIENVVAFALKWKAQFSTDKEKEEINDLLSRAKPPFMSVRYFHEVDSGITLTTEHLSKWLDFKQCTRLIHSFTVKKDVAEVFVYNEAKKQWGTVSNIKLDTEIASNWVPVVRKIDNYFFFAVSNSKRYVAFDVTKNEYYYGPECDNFDKDLSNNTNNCEEIHFVHLNDDSYAIFNFNRKEWRMLQPEAVFCGQIVLSTKDLLYFDFDTFINVYDKRKNEWSIEMKPQWFLDMRAVRCKCFGGGCEPYVICANRNMVCVYHNQKWESRHIPNVSLSSPVLANCDQCLLLLKGKYRLNVYYPFAHVRWVDVSYPKVDYDWENCILDISFKCNC